MYVHTLTTTASPSQHLAHTYMHTYQMGDGCDGAVSLKRDRSSLTMQNKNRVEAGTESD